MAWPVSVSPFDVELACFLKGHRQEDGGLGKAGHCREIISKLWGKDNPRQHFVFNPWSDKIIEECCTHKYLSISGCANSTKSDTLAVLAIVNYLASPLMTMVLITSTSLKESRGRIWGRIEDYWLAAQHVTNNGLPGKLVPSIGLIRFHDPSGEFKSSDRCGIHLIAGEKKKEKEAIGKMIGLKNYRVFFYADELPELSHAIPEAAFSNLAANPEFEFKGTGNPASVYDPHGQFSKPKDGWKSITPADDEWETEKGYAIRFDALKSPNVLAGRTIYKFLPTTEKIEAARHDTGGDDSPAFWRMWRGFWCPSGASQSVVSEADIVKYGCEELEVSWAGGEPPEFSFLDPAFTSGGDRSIAHFGRLGVESGGKHVLLYTGYERIDPDVTIKSEPHSQQVIRAWRKLCEARGITAQRAAYDNTGSAAFGDLVTIVWSRACTPINWGGKASQLRISANDKTLACDKYANRATEIWAVIREYIRSGQIRGIQPDLGQELTARRMVHKKDIGLKAQVETKELYRTRTGKSPDIADAAVGLLDFLRSKYHFRAAERTARASEGNTNWNQWVKKKQAMIVEPTLDRAA